MTEIMIEGMIETWTERDQHLQSIHKMFDERENGKGKSDNKSGNERERESKIECEKEYNSCLLAYITWRLQQ